MFLQGLRRCRARGKAARENIVEAQLGRQLGTMLRGGPSEPVDGVMLNVSSYRSNKTRKSKFDDSILYGSCQFSA
jgi:hypothetical protein